MPDTSNPPATPTSLGDIIAEHVPLTVLGQAGL